MVSKIFIAVGLVLGAVTGISKLFGWIDDATLTWLISLATFLTGGGAGSEATKITAK